jgi:alkylated DNA repair dioxygenase AlkB
MITTKIISENGFQDSIFIYIPNFLTPEKQKELLTWSQQQPELQVETSSTDNSEQSISRLQKWYQQEGKYFCPKWKKRFKKWKSNEMSSEISNLQVLVDNYMKNIDFEYYGIPRPNFNSCLVNKYRDGNDYIKPHRDTHLSFGEEPCIAGVSLGCSRMLEFKRVIKNNKVSLSKKDKNRENLNFSIKLNSGSLFLMMGSSQRFWSHGIPKSNDSEARYSFTFREYIC